METVLASFSGAGLTAGSITAPQFLASAAAGNTAAAVGTGLFSGISTAELLMGSAGGISILSTLSSASIDAKMMELQADQAGIAADSELLAGREDALRHTIELNKTLAHNIVAAGASGIDLSSGSIQTAQEEAIRKADFETSISRSNAEQRSLSKRQQRTNYVINARGRRTGGLMEGAATGLDVASRYYERGR